MKRILLIAAVAASMCSHMMAQEVARFKGNARAAVSYTFDDGLVEHYTMVMPHLDSLGIKGTFWIIADNIDRRKPMVDHLPVTWEQLVEIAAHGHELGNHGFTHTALDWITPEEGDREIERNDSAIYAHTGIHPVSFCFPGNGRNDEMIARVLAHPRINGARTFETGIGGGATVESLDAWLASAIEKGEWVVGMTHGMTHGWDRFDHPEVLWQHLEHAKLLADSGQVWIATFAQVNAYLKGISDTATYILPRKPKKVTQQGKRLTMYQSWDGKWCVDAKRDIKLKIKY
ncbi:MAG: polysaccharide deacetylase family protein [Muribaculaceae bacterium]|nr:polysaccharide deacetylase family protein [Muribaculaceae bacterium]